MSRAEKSDFRSRQRAKFSGGQTEAFDDWGVANNLNKLYLVNNDENTENKVLPLEIDENVEITQEVVTNNVDDSNEFKVVAKKKQGRKKMAQSSLLTRSAW